MKKANKSTLKTVDRFHRMREKFTAEFSHLVKGRIIDLKIVDAPRGTFQPDGTFDDGKTRYVWVNTTTKYLAIAYEVDDGHIR